MDIGARIARIERNLERLQRASRLSSASLDDTALEVRDGAGSLRGIVGQQGDGTTAVTIVNGPPPPTPSTPVVVSVLGGVTVSWDGAFADGAVIPLDWSRVEVHASPLAVYTPTAATLKATVETAQGCTVVIATPDPVYVQLVARSTSGTASAPSATVGPVGPTAVVASDILDGIVTTVKLANGAVAAAKLAVGAVGTVALADGAVLAEKLADAAVKVAKIDTGAVTGPAIAANAVTAGKVAADAITAREIAAGAITASEVAAGAITTDKLTVTGGANLLSDPSFEGAYTASCVAGIAYATQDTSKGNGSPSSIKIDAVSASPAYRAVQITQAPALPGDQFALGVDYWVSADWAGTEIDFQIRWETASGTILSYGKATTGASPVREAWTRLTGTYTAPATATVARVRVESGNATAGTVWFDNASVRPVLGGTQIQDGAVTTQKIVAGAVQTAQLDVDAVNASKIAAGSVTTAKLAALAVTANELAANAVTAGKILAGSVSAQSLTIGVAQSIAIKLTDTMADSSTWARVGETGTFATVTGVTDAVTGSTVMQVTGPASMERAENIPYDAAALYRVTVRLRTTTAPTTGTATVYLGLTGIAADGTTRVNISGANAISSQHYITLSNTIITAGTAWTTVTGYIQGTAATGTTVTSADPRTPGKAHTNVRYIRPLLRLLFGATGGVMQVDQVTVETVPTGVVNSVNIVDGAITANAIAANAVIAGKILAGSVDATALKADAITGKTITGGTIIGAVIETGATGKRIVLDTNQLSVLDASNLTVAEITPDDGDGRSAFYVYDIRSGDEYYATLTAGDLRFGITGVSVPSTEGFIAFDEVSTGFFEMLLSSGTAFGNAPAEINLYSDTSPTGDDSSIVLNATTTAVRGAAISLGETWQAPSFSANWATTGTLNGATGYRGMKYRKTAEDEVWVIGSAVAAAGAGVTVFVLPTGYRPPTGSRALLPAYFSTGSGTPAAGWAQVTETGSVAVNTGISGWTIGTGTQVWINGKFPLGNIT